MEQELNPCVNPVVLLSTASGLSRRGSTGVWKMESLLEPTTDLAWVLATEGFDALREAIYESRFAISNGSIGLRAGRVVSRGERWDVPHRAYLAGLFDIPGPELPCLHLFPVRGSRSFGLCFPAVRSSTTLPRRSRIARHST